MLGMTTASALPTLLSSKIPQKKTITVGVYLPDFGPPVGTLLLCRFDDDELDELADETEYFMSGLSCDYYEPYNRERFIRTLSDWGWYGPTN